MFRIICQILSFLLSIFLNLNSKGLRYIAVSFKTIKVEEVAIYLRVVKYELRNTTMTDNIDVLIYCSIQVLPLCCNV